MRIAFLLFLGVATANATPPVPITPLPQPAQPKIVKPAPPAPPPSVSPWQSHVVRTPGMLLAIEGRADDVPTTTDPRPPWDRLQRASLSWRPHRHVHVGVGVTRSTLQVVDDFSEGWTPTVVVRLDAW
jgi:hypothetical protein